jgi:hypothetical protein
MKRSSIAIANGTLLAVSQGCKLQRAIKTSLDALRLGREIALQMTTLSPDKVAWKSDLVWFDGRIKAASD